MASLLTNSPLETEHEEVFYFFTFLTIPASEPGLILFKLVYRFSQWGQGKQTITLLYKHNLQYQVHLQKTDFREKRKGSNS